MSGVLQEIQQMIALDSEHCVFIESSNALLFFFFATDCTRIRHPSVSYLWYCTTQRYVCYRIESLINVT
jgi:hypothetical protein